MRLVLPALALMACSDMVIHGKAVHVLPGEDTAQPEDTATEDDTDTAEPEDTDAPEDTNDPEDTDDPEDPPPDGGFSLGWHILDEGRLIDTTTDPAHYVDHHGDFDLYWYEPSGLHGLIDSASPQDDFAELRNYILDRVPEPMEGIGLLHYYRDSVVDTYHRATFTYVLCDFWVESGEDFSDYELVTGQVDDGVKVMVNGVTLGHLKLDDPGTSWNLASVLSAGRNTLVVILVDDSERNKFIQDMAFYRAGEMVTGSDVPPPPM